jgi:hypothetical protein
MEDAPPDTHCSFLSTARQAAETVAWVLAHRVSHGCSVVDVIHLEGGAAHSGVPHVFARHYAVIWSAGAARPDAIPHTTLPCDGLRGLGSPLVGTRVDSAALLSLAEESGSTEGVSQLTQVRTQMAARYRRETEMRRSSASRSPTHPISLLRHGQKRRARFGTPSAKRMRHERQWVSGFGDEAQFDPDSLCAPNGCPNPWPVASRATPTPTEGSRGSPYPCHERGGFDRHDIAPALRFESSPPWGRLPHEVESAELWLTPCFAAIGRGGAKTTC